MNAAVATVETHPRLRGLTPSGRGLAALSVAGYLLGWWLGWIELMVLATGCALAFVVALVSIAGRFRVVVDRTVEPRRVEVGRPAVGTLVVTNRTRHRSPRRVAEDRVGEEVVPVDIPALAPGASTQTTYVLPTNRRGILDVGPLVMTKSDPIGLFKRQKVHSGVHELWVHPRVHSVSVVPAGQLRDLDGPTFDGSPQGSNVFHALREYAHGDDLRHIHWRSTARMGKPMVKHFVDNRRPQLTVLLDIEAESYPDPRMFELAVEIAASIGVSALRRRYPLSMHAASATIARAGVELRVEGLLDRLTPLQTQTSEGLSVTALRAQRESAGTNLAVIVTGQPDDERLLGAVRQLEQARTVIVQTARRSASSSPRIGRAKVLDVTTAAEFVNAWGEAMS